jgi:hypothetical protein
MTGFSSLFKDIAKCYFGCARKERVHKNATRNPAITKGQAPIDEEEIVPEHARAMSARVGIPFTPRSFLRIAAVAFGFSGSDLTPRGLAGSPKPMATLS